MGDHILIKTDGFRNTIPEPLVNLMLELFTKCLYEHKTYQENYRSSPSKNKMLRLDEFIDLEDASFKFDNPGDYYSDTLVIRVSMHNTYFFIQKDKNQFSLRIDDTSGTRLFGSKWKKQMFKILDAYNAGKSAKSALKLLPETTALVEKIMEGFTPKND